MKKIQSTKYPSLGTMYGFWHKPLNFTLTIIILTIIILVVFIFGAWFVIKYNEIWKEIEINGTSTYYQINKTQPLGE